MTIKPTIEQASCQQPESRLTDKDAAHKPQVFDTKDPNLSSSAAKAKFLDSQWQVDSKSVSSQQSRPLPPTYDIATSKEAQPWMDSQCRIPLQSTDISLEANLPNGSPRRQKSRICKRCLRGCMHLLFAVILLLLGVGFALRAAPGRYRSLDQYPTPGDRRIIVHSHSKNIIGDYPLLDLLYLDTRSGSIDVSVTPDSADRNGPAQPAEFVANTMSGSVSAYLPSLTRIPNREYITRVSSRSGSVSGTYLMGPTSSFKTTSGNIDLLLLPAVYGNVPPSLITSGVSNSQHIVILAGDNQTALQTMVIQSQSVSGSVTLRCPGDFEGAIQVHTTSGSISVMGPGVKIVKNEHSPGFRYVEATKGRGTGKIVVNTVSGSVSVVIG